VSAPKQEFVHDFIFLRSTNLDGSSSRGFVWPREVGAIVEAPDWNPEPVCGYGLHGIKSGLGDWGLMTSPGDPSALWWVLGARSDESVSINEEKIKVRRCKVLYFGSFAGAMALVTPAMTRAIRDRCAERTKAAKLERGGRSRKVGGLATASGVCGAATASGDSGAATASGDSGAATASGVWGAATASGDRGAATASGAHGVALACGRFSRGRVEKGCLLILVERDEDGKILHHFSAMCGRRGVKPGVWYTLTGGKLTVVS